jgi:hypothetical protein
MTKTHVYLLVPEYAGVTGTIQAAYDLASNVDPNGPIQFHLKDYPERNPKEYMKKDDSWDGMREKRYTERFSRKVLMKEVDASINYSLAYARENRKWLETPDQVLERMANAEDWFFETSKADRENSLVILLNPFGNYPNYFCGPSPERRNVAFIQTTHYATETLTARHIPVAYEMFASAMRFQAFNVPDYQDRFVHMRDKGCMNDFFSDIKNIRLKILSADICDDCYGYIRSQTVNPLFIDHIYKGFEAVRAQQNSFTRARRERITLDLTTSVRYLKFDSIGAQVSLAPKEMALYKFYLNHPEGVAYSSICDHRDELYALYEEHYQQTHSDDAQVDQSERRVAINAVLDRWCMQDEDLTQTVSKINRKIKQAITDELAKPHQILGPRGGKRKIAALA